MNDIQQMQKIKEIVDDHFIRGSQILEDVADNGDVNAVKRAEECFTEGLKKFNKIQLSRKGNQNIHLIRKAMEYAIKSTKALQKGQYSKAERLIKKMSEYAFKYADSVNKEVSCE